LLLLACAFFAAHIVAAPGADVPVLVSDVWVTGSTPSQKTTGAFMRLTSTRNLTLLDVASPAAKVVELHEMRRDGTAMRMRRIAKLELTEGKVVRLEPGGFHIMQFGLVQPLKKGDWVPLTLSFADPQGKRWTLAVSAECVI
jgi:hypothetical protein